MTPCFCWQLAEEKARGLGSDFLATAQRRDGSGSQEMPLQLACWERLATSKIRITWVHKTEVAESPFTATEDQPPVHPTSPPSVISLQFTVIITQSSSFSPNLFYHSSVITYCPSALSPRSPALALRIQSSSQPSALTILSLTLMH